MDKPPSTSAVEDGDSFDEEFEELVPKRLCVRRATTRSENEFTGDNTKWNLDEKRKLYNALIKYGSNNLDEIAKHIPTKNKSTVLSYIINLEKSARGSLKQKDSVRQRTTVRKAPIDMWIEYVCQMSSSDNYKLTDISRALKYISLFEQNSDKSNVAMSDCYEVLGSCLSGHAPKYLNPQSSLFLAEKLQELAKNIKLKNHSNEDKFLSTLPRRKKTRFAYISKKKIDSENQGQDSFLTNEAMNPLKIPENLLLVEK